MKNTSILIPIILICCLAALGFLFYKALQTVDDDRARGNNQIVLNQEDYAEGNPDDLGQTADYPDEETTNRITRPAGTTGNVQGGASGETQGGTADDGQGGTAGSSGNGNGNNEMVEMTAAERAAAERADREEDERLKREEMDRELAEAAAKARRADLSNAGNNTSVATRSTSAGNSGNRTGRYLVIAGSFRQRANADLRVKDLRRAGFTDTRMEKFNRGTYAVALAGQTNRYTEAKRMAEKIVGAGFEARVMRRR